MNQPRHGGNLAWAAAFAGCPPARILDFSASINPLGPPASVLTALQAAVRSVGSGSHFAALVHYPDPDYTWLRSLLGKIHQLDDGYILPGNGAAELLTWAARDLARLAGVMFPTPAFGDYQRALGCFDARMLPWKLDLDPPVTGFSGLRLPSRVNLLIQPEQAGLLLNNPHNPTGQLWSRETLLPYLQQFALVVVDEAFMDFLPDGEQQSLDTLVPDYPNLVVLRSLTKFYSLPGLRLGYAIAQPERLQRWQGWRDPWPVNGLALVAAEAMLADREFQQRTWDWLPLARQQLLQGLAALPGLSPRAGAANFLLVGCERSVPKLQQQLLQQEQILIRDCTSFPELGEHFFRVAVRTEAENQRLLAGLRQILG